MTCHTESNSSASVNEGKGDSLICFAFKILLLITFRQNSYAISRVNGYLVISPIKSARTIYTPPFNFFSTVSRSVKSNNS